MPHIPVARLATVAAVAGLLASPLAAPPAHALDPSGVQEITLSNGMPVVLWHDDSIPTIALYLFWKVGSRNEAPGITGMAHFFEHMMFNGSAKYPPGEFDRVMEAAGGANNAYTTNDVTVYTDWLPTSALDVVLDLEADRIGHLSVDPGVVESERGVVMSERLRSVEDDNQSLLLEELDSIAFLAHPYQWPVIGWASDIENWRQEDVEQFFEDWYAPNNAVVAICGAFDPATIEAKLEATLGAVPAGEIPRDVVTVEPAQKGERRGQLRKPARLASLAMGWHIPESGHADRPALELAELLLTRGESSRLYRRLVDRDELALWVWLGSESDFDPGLLRLMAEAREGVDTVALESAIGEELARLGREGPGERELEKARNQYLTGFYRDMASLRGRANALGSHELYEGGWEELFRTSERYGAVTADDIRRVVATYLRDENRTVMTLVPTAAEENDAR